MACKQSPLMNVTRSNHLTWYRHVKKMQKSRFPKVALKGTIAGKRSRGRPKKRQEDNLLDNLKAIGSIMQLHYHKIITLDGWIDI